MPSRTRGSAAAGIARVFGTDHAFAHAGLRVLLDAAHAGDERALATLSPIVDAARGRPVVVLPELETGP